MTTQDEAGNIRAFPVEPRPQRSGARAHCNNITKSEKIKMQRKRIVLLRYKNVKTMPRVNNYWNEKKGNVIGHLEIARY